MRRLRWSALCLLCLSWSCQSYESTLVEFDSVTGTSAGEQRGIELKDTVDRLPWGIRRIECTGLDWLLVRLFGIERSPHPVDDPVRLQRERMRDLWQLAPWNAPERCEAVVRLLMVADRRREPRELHRADALYGLSILAESMAMPAAPPPRVLVPSPEAAAKTRELVVRLLGGWPAGRTSPREPAEQAAFLLAIDEGAAHPWADSHDRRMWLRALMAAHRQESETPVVEGIERALTASMASAVAATLWEGTEDPAAMVREQTASALVRAMGPGVMPALLQRMAAGGRRGANGLLRLDADANVVRTLVNHAATVDVATAGRSFEGGATVLEFLEQVATSEDPGLRMVGMLALCRVLGREVSYDPAWLNAWVQAGRPVAASRPAGG